MPKHCAEQMRAMVLERANDVVVSPLVVQDVPLPKAISWQVRVKVHICGVCRTDFHIVEGDLASVKGAVILWHQIVGVVQSKARRTRSQRRRSR